MAIAWVAYTRRSGKASGKSTIHGKRPLACQLRAISMRAQELAPCSVCFRDGWGCQMPVRTKAHSW